MSSKRPSSPDLIPNPFIKKRNLAWTLAPPSPPSPDDAALDEAIAPAVTTAAVESGSVHIDDHLAHFTKNLSSHIVSSDGFSSRLSSPPLLSISDYAALYSANAGNPRGAHFVIHQHDHPVAGTHYDLRLQINETSSASWAIMYGLPGDPNSVRLNRNATETRIHCLWNHLIETASYATGSLLIWDTGTYTVLPRTSKHAPAADPASQHSSSPQSSDTSTPQSLLHAAFQNRKIRLQLHGSRLPEPYVLNLRLTKTEDAVGRTRSGRAPRTRRRKRDPREAQAAAQPETSDEDEAPRGSRSEDDEDVPSSADAGDAADADSVSAMEKEIRELEDEHVRATNAYPGASNTIGSVHQRRWYLSLDRRACGFQERRTNKGRPVWHPSEGGTEASESPNHDAGSEPRLDSHASFPFYVRGADRERSVVTGRRGEDILRDEGVVGFVQRKGWMPVLN